MAVPNYSLYAVLDLMGGKPGCHFSVGSEVCPTITRGRGAVSDVHSLCLVRCYMENQRCEVRPIDGSGQIVSALPASSGGRQFNIILQEGDE